MWKLQPKTKQNLGTGLIRLVISYQETKNIYISLKLRQNKVIK